MEAEEEFRPKMSAASWDKLPLDWESWLEFMLVEILKVLRRVKIPLTPVSRFSMLLEYINFLKETIK